MRCAFHRFNANIDQCRYVAASYLIISERRNRLRVVIHVDAGSLCVCSPAAPLVLSVNTLDGSTGEEYHNVRCGADPSFVLMAKLARLYIEDLHCD